MLNQKSVQSRIPPYFQYKESPCISYSYARSVASKIFNNKASLQQINSEDLSNNPTPCSRCDSEFLYALYGHIVTGDLSIVRNQNLKDVLRKGPKYRELVLFSWHQNFDIIMDACEEYARRWAKKEDVEVDTLSEWVKSIASVLKRRIRRLKRSVNTRHQSIFCDLEVVRELSRLYICLQEVLLQRYIRNPTYNVTYFSASEVLDNHKSVLTSFGIDPNEDERDLPYIYWIPKMHKDSYKRRFIAGSAKCSTKPLSLLLTELLTPI